MYDPMINLFKEVNLPREWYTNYYKNGQILRVEVSERQNTWDLFMEFPKLIPIELTHQFAVALMNHYKEWTVQVHYRYQSIDHQVALQQAKTFIQKQINENHTRSAAAWLGKAEWVLQGNEICIQLPNPAVQAMAEKLQIADHVARYYREYTGSQMKVRLVSEQNQADYRTELLQKRTEEEQMLIEQAMEAERERAATMTDVAEPSIQVAKKLGVHIGNESVQIQTIQEEDRRVTVQGKIFKAEIRELKSGRKLLIFNITDYTDSISCKCFARDKEQAQVFQQIQNGDWVKIRGDVQFDTFSRELCFMVNDLQEVSIPVRKDDAEEKRIELHLHTSMSPMDGLLAPSDFVKKVAKWGHKAVAITDHGGVQAFPKAYEAAKDTGIKLLFGMEANIVDDAVPVTMNPRPTNLVDETYVVFDVETTGLSAVHDVIIELAAVKIHNGKVIDKFSEFANPHRPLAPKIIELTHITDSMLVDAPEVDEVVARFLEFIGDCVLVAHNARFDMGFLQQAVNRINGPQVVNPVIDTLELGRFLYPSLKNHRLNNLSKHLDVHLEQHHRAIYDAEATGYVFWKMAQEAEKRKLFTLEDLNQNVDFIDVKRSRPYHVILFAKNETGLYHLYKLVSIAHTEYFYRVPRIPRSKLEEFREGLVIGSGCEKGELYDAALNKSPEDVEKLAGFYDYLEIQPIDVNMHLVEKGFVASPEQLRAANRLIVQMGEKLGKPVVATSNAHYLNPEEAIHRTILYRNLSGGRFTDDLSPAHLRTTNEMLQEFSYLGEKKAREVVITNTHLVADMMEELKPFPDDLHAPKLEGAEEELRDSCYENAKAKYGNDLPEIVEARLEKELKSIIGNGFAVIYIISRRLVMKSNEDGYLVGSRGSVGSSFVATMSNITEVNPLQPHYVCSSCQYSEFILDGSVDSGFDLPEKDCPKCGTKLDKDGQDIPFETFLGFEGDKTPDIDLNFSGEYQGRIHEYTEEWLGKQSIFRAGTIATVKEKTAIGYVKKYAEQQSKNLRFAEIQRLAEGCVDVKRTTGQHPGGLMVVPQGSDVLKFTPVQYPADDMNAKTETTHFNYKAIEGRLLKLDLLAHQDPTTLRMLQDTSGIDPLHLPLDDSKVLSIFNSLSALGIKPESVNGIKVGTTGIPEFGTGFVRQMLEETRPTTFSELVRISGLSHGTDVWLGNAQELVKKGHKLSETICTRDEIMSYLMYQGLPPKLSFDIMEKVRKGKGLSPEFEEEMRSNKVPEWYIDSCKKIKYMFPRAHAVAYVTMAVRIAWYKVYQPIHYYAAFFYRMIDGFDCEVILKGPTHVEQTMKEIKDKGFSASAKEKNLYTTLELVQEFFARGFTFKPIDIYRSHATQFVMEGEQTLIPPFKSLEGLGESVAYKIMEARKNGDFLSIDDFQQRTKASSTTIDLLRTMGCMEGLPQSNQLTLF
ncbi:DNA polymerase-3 subunit alpha (Gram-positive type) [Croceifilum oryzae]|uniref:DNA polymerase III PolC-type n=1 Tax=Croceifilum oryzae TaxID=1553429 RepID=A0AAJ1WS76_9BACL|nr:PolC-type DNA polymerase III [Croceifilum oryzae]MDQ0417385.1 DNA polymerase-3 subunit alpha (Gram-positive type) [Croceifilum oryzae]